MIEYTPGDYAWRIAFRIKGSVMPSALLISIPSAALACLLCIYYDYTKDTLDQAGLSQTTNTALWVSVSVPVLSLIGYRTQQALQRFWEGTSLLHAMRGEWFDSASCLATFSKSALKTQPQAVDKFRQTLLRLMSLCHGSALDEIKCNANENYEVLDITGLDDKTLKIIRDCKHHGFNRVEVILHMIQVLVIDAQENKVIAVPPPILSRVYQTLSRGFVNLLSAKKIKDTPYPFPYAQLIAVQVIIMALLTPLVMSTLLQHKGWSPICTFIPMFSILCLNYTAEALEMPYGDDANDLPLGRFQQEMNSSLLMLIHEYADHVPSTSIRAKTQYGDLSVSLRNDRRTMQLAVLPNSKTFSQSDRQSLQSNFSSLYAEDFIDDDGPPEIPNDDQEEFPKMRTTNTNGSVSFNDIVEELPPVSTISVPTSSIRPEIAGAKAQRYNREIDELDPQSWSSINHGDGQGSLPDDLVPRRRPHDSNYIKSSRKGSSEHGVTFALTSPRSGGSGNEGPNGCHSEQGNHGGNAGQGNTGGTSISGFQVFSSSL